MLMIESCVSGSKSFPTPVHLDFKTAKSIFDQSMSAEDIEKFLGSPVSKQRGSGEEEKWSYNDGAGGIQRLVVSLSKNDGVRSILWIPRAGEAEATLIDFKRVNAGFQLKVVRIEEMARPHTDATETTYTDGGDLIILHNDRSSRIEAIAWIKNDKSRQPSESTSNRPRPSVEF